MKCPRCLGMELKIRIEAERVRFMNCDICNYVAVDCLPKPTQLTGFSKEKKQ